MYRILIASLLCAIAMPSVGGWFGTQFSADAVQVQPQGQRTTGKMFVGSERVRTEMERDGQLVVEVVSPAKGVAWLLFPAGKVYLERELGPAMAAMAGSGKGDPCAGSPGMTCRRIAEERLNGRASIKWEISGTAPGHTFHSSQWLDAEHGFPVRQEVAGQPLFELRHVGVETIGGRHTEKWESAIYSPDGAVGRGIQWYDPRLNTAIRQEMPGGHLRELTDIREGEQPNHLFTLPSDYKKVDSLPGRVPGSPGRK